METTTGLLKSYLMTTATIDLAILRHIEAKIRPLTMKRHDSKAAQIQSHTSDQNINVLESSSNGIIPEQSKTSQGENNAN